MPIIIGTAKVVTIKLGGENRQVYVWPKSFADDTAISVARAQAPCEEAREAEALAMVLYRLARKSDGKPLYDTIEQMKESISSDEVPEAVNVIGRAVMSQAEENDPGNP